MARFSGRTYRAPQCAKCNRAGAMHSPYSDRYLCASCLSFERAVANAQAAQQAAEQAAQQQTQDEAEFMAQWQEARQDAIDMRAWATGH